MATLTPEFSERYIELMNNLPNGLRHIVRPVLGAMGVGSTRHVVQGGGGTMLQAHPYLALVKRVADMSPAGLVPHIYRAALLKEDEAAIAQLQQGGSMGKVFGRHVMGPYLPHLPHIARSAALASGFPLVSGIPFPPPWHFWHKTRLQRAEDNISGSYSFTVDDHDLKADLYTHEENFKNGINNASIWEDFRKKMKGTKMRDNTFNPLTDINISSDIANNEVTFTFKCMTIALMFILMIVNRKSSENDLYGSVKKLQSLYRSKSQSDYATFVNSVKSDVTTDTSFKDALKRISADARNGANFVKAAFKAEYEKGGLNIAGDAQKIYQLGGGSGLDKLDSAVHMWMTEMAMRKLVRDLEVATNSRKVLGAFHTHSPTIMYNMMAGDLAARRGWRNRLSTVNGSPLMPGGGYDAFQKILPKEVHAPVDPNSKYAKMSAEAWAEANNVSRAPAAQKGAGISLLDV